MKHKSPADGTRDAFRRPRGPLFGVAKAASRGWTMVEMVITLAIVAILATIALGKYQDYQERIKLSRAITELAAMSTRIKLYTIDNQTPPDSLADVGLGGKIDPWGRPYYYLNLTTQNGKGKSRRDKSLNPLNTDFDLYSAGKDGLTQTSLMANGSRDDVIRARDGKFIGLAADFDP